MLSQRPWRSWYNHKRHRARRALQLQKQPLCEVCLAQGRTTPATIVDHIEPHGGDMTKFFTGKLQSLCKPCHDRKWADDRRGYSTAVDASGYPIDKRHPAYAHTRKYGDDDTT
jgi:5-methylcytosine-specific restriction protein A